METNKTTYIRPGFHAVAPYITVNGANQFMAFVGKVFNGVVTGNNLRPDGTVQHAEMLIDNSAIMLSEANDTYPAMPIWLHLYVPDVDATYQLALDAGATSIMPPANQDYGDRSAGVLDAFGNTWWLATYIGDEK